MWWPKKYGVACLAIWLVLHGLMVLLNLSFTRSGDLLAVLALVAGILLWLDR